MKLSFSTRGWESLNWEEWLCLAQEMRFGGIEIYNPQRNAALFDRSGPFHKYTAGATLRALSDAGISIPCLDSSIDISMPDGERGAVSLIDMAAELRVPCVSVVALNDDEDRVRGALTRLLPAAGEKRVTLLIKTSGIYADTARLRQVLDHFACDELAALWDMHHPYRDHGETAAADDHEPRRICAPCAYAATPRDDGGAYIVWSARATLPIAEMMRALSSVNYDGFISIEWKPEWMEDLHGSAGHLPALCKLHAPLREPAAHEKSALYYNRAHTGQFVWKKDTLIDATFPQVLDRMVGGIPRPDLPSRYTTLDYTRTLRASSATTWTSSPAR